MGSIQEITLPVSGQTAQGRRPTGRDIVEAEKLALISRLSVIGDRTVPFEHLLAMDAEDIGALMSVDLGFTESRPKPS